ncbi:hypothetical protein PQQ73_17450 [Paraburkholderia strydomiana]|uniref:Tyr recombinase domain-containing protein n=1 Tax=Paraburkholderia strydomiana TaxID=1245417 RepID=A0ABW9EGF6_9BURK
MASEPSTVHDAYRSHPEARGAVRLAADAKVQLEVIIGKRPQVRKRLMLTDEEIHVLTNAAMSEENRLSVCILLATGVRASESFTAQRADVFLDAARWHMPAS